MAFNVTAQTPKLVENLGAFSPFAVGMATMSSGKATVTFPGLRRVDGVIGMVQGATGVGETVICTATSTNTADIETVNESGSAGGSSVVMLIAWGIPSA